MDELTVEEAMQRLDVIDDYDPGDGPKPCVHTLRSPGVGMAIGAHWSLQNVRALMEKFGVAESGQNAEQMGHGLVVIDDVSPLFLATKRADQ